MSPQKSSSLKKTTVINAPIEEVFQFFTDPEQVAKYMPNVVNIRNISGAQGVGTTWDYEYAVAGLTFKGTSECVEYDPNKTFGIRSEGGYPSDWLYSFESAGPNTRVTVQVDYDNPDSLLKKITRKPLLRIHDGAAEHGMQSAKLLIENSSG